jgi:hypothetical protein
MSKPAAFLVLALAGAGCHSVPDACSGFAGKTCLSLEIRAAAGAPASLSQVVFESTTAGLISPRANASPPAPATPPFSLPVVIAILPAPGFSGAFRLHARGIAGGASVAAGDVTGSLRAGAHAQATLTLAAGSALPEPGVIADLEGPSAGGSDGMTASGDMSGEGGGDMSESGGDMAGSGTRDMASGADLSPGADLSLGADMAPVCTPSSKRCSGGNLQTCRLDGSGYTTTTCALGCGTAGGPHCDQFIPSAPVTPSDLDDSDLTVPDPWNRPSIIFDTATGGITSSGVLRDPNTSPAATRQVHQGIAFRIANGVAIWTFKGFTVRNGAFQTVIVFTSSDPTSNNAVALVSTADLNVNGVIDARGYADPTQTACGDNKPGPGGGAGGALSTSAVGKGPNGAGAGGVGPIRSSAGGGAGFGGGGGSGDGGNGGTSGMTYGSATLAPLIGGSGGGAGGGGALGGGGGGAIQLVAAGKITFSGTASSPGGVNAGGCGGLTSKDGGGGGGSGGAILVEALGGVDLQAFGGLAVNGGGGAVSGGVGTTPNGSPGGLNQAQAPGGGNGGGAGGTRTLPGGQPGNGGGGGGGAGRIRINTLTGAATFETNSILSPGPNDAQTSQGFITIQ